MRRTDLKEMLLQRESFEDFRIGDFPFDPEHSAMGEYHYYPPSGYRGNWYCPLTDSNWRGPMWMVVQTRQKKFMENQMIFPEQICWRRGDRTRFFWNLLVTGNPGWRDFVLEASVKMLNTNPVGLGGVAFRYHTSRQHYLFCLEEGKAKLIKRNHEVYEELASQNYAYDSDGLYILKVECRGNRIVCSVNDKVLVTPEDSEYDMGRIALKNGAKRQRSRCSKADSRSRNSGKAYNCKTSDPVEVYGSATSPATEARIYC
jgi:hypothetical protein